jgi:hypothetical protein
MGRVSRSQAASDVSATAAFRWILAAITFMWILATTASSQPSRPEFQHSSPTIQPWILAVAAVGTFSCRASLDAGNASVDDIHATTKVTLGARIELY